MNCLGNYLLHRLVSTNSGQSLKQVMLENEDSDA